MYGGVVYICKIYIFESGGVKMRVGKYLLNLTVLVTWDSLRKV